jgi:hypothetical protein
VSCLSNNVGTYRQTSKNGEYVTPKPAYEKLITNEKWRVLEILDYESRGLQGIGVL